MRISVFEKEVFGKGSQGVVSAKIIATLNYGTKPVTGTHAVTHDDFSKNVPIHKVEVIINGKVWLREHELVSEIQVYNESQRLIKLAQEHVDKLANSEPVPSFAEKMRELFTK